MDARTLTPKKESRGKNQQQKVREINMYLQSRVMPLLAPLQMELITQQPKNMREHCIQWLKEYHQRTQDPKEMVSDEEPDQVFQARRKKVRSGRRACRKGVSGESTQDFQSMVRGEVNKQLGRDEIPPKNEWPEQTKANLIIYLKKFFLFQHLSQQSILQLIEKIKLKYTEKGQIVIKEGDCGNALYIVDQGRFKCQKYGNSEWLREYKSGEVFGQLALLYNHPRATTITSLTPGKLFQLNREQFNLVLRGKTIQKLQQSSTLIQRIDFFKDLDVFQRSKLLQNLQVRRVPAERYLIKEGEVGNCFYIVAEGQLAAYKKKQDGNKLVYAYKRGDYFGEIALLKNVPRQASIKTLTQCRLFYINRDSFVRVIGPLQGILSRSCQRYSIWGGQLSGEGDSESMH